MTLTFSSKPNFNDSRVRFIMVRPSHPGNVGAAARAIKTMGFHDLCLVAPRHRHLGEHADAVALASGATDVLSGLQEVDTLEEALSSVTLAFALTARPREIGPPACDIREAAALSCEHLHNHQTSHVAIVLGTERTGLDNDHIALCQRICHIPANPDYSSLNVAQAAQLTAWELRYALATASAQPLLPDTHGAPAPGAEPAPNSQVEALIEHLETALIATDFLDPAHPKKLMARMRHLLGRCALTRDETNMLRGVCTAMIKASRKDIN